MTGKRLASLLLSLSLILSAALPTPAVSAQTHASGSGAPIVITELQTGGLTGTPAVEDSSHEFIELYNQTHVTLDVSGWKVQYLSASGGTTTDLAVLNGTIIGHGFVLLSYDGYLGNGDLAFKVKTGGDVAASGGHVQLVDPQDTVVDRVGWGTAEKAETLPTAAPKHGYSLKRLAETEFRFIDTDNNKLDFMAPTTTSTPQGGGYVATIPSPPPLPDSEEPGEETPEDIEYFPIVLSELLPNPAGSDSDGTEFIELYNPNNQAVSLEGYKLSIGSGLSTTKTLDNYSIPARGYLALYSSETKLTLTNTSGKARLTAPDGSMPSETETYTDAADDMAWALIDDTWQFSNVPTPNAANAASRQVQQVSGVAVTIEPCDEGKYRNPETNRCRSIEAESQLTPCAEGQERNPATNRCRAIASVVGVLAPCQEGQERNPETNRCRKIATDDGLTPCDEGQERNPETNRCRKVTTGTVLGSGNPATTVASTAALPGNLSWWITGAAAMGVVGYGAYEWRAEAMNMVGRLRSRFTKSGPPDA